jgi:hypothetical protein
MRGSKQHDGRGAHRGFSPSGDFQGCEDDLKVWSEGERLRVIPGVLTPRLREELVMRKEEVLDFIRQTRGVNGHAAPMMRPPLKGLRDQPCPFPCAETAWVVEQMHPGRSGYHVGSVRLEGICRLRRCATIVELVRRHESLRTRFPVVGEGPVQEIADEEPEVEVIDLARGRFGGRKLRPCRMPPRRASV